MLWVRAAGPSALETVEILLGPLQLGDARLQSGQGQLVVGGTTRHDQLVDSRLVVTAQESISARAMCRSVILPALR